MIYYIISQPVYLLCILPPINVIVVNFFKYDHMCEKTTENVTIVTKVLKKYLKRNIPNDKQIKPELKLQKVICTRLGQ